VYTGKFSTMQKTVQLNWLNFVKKRCSLETYCQYSRLLGGSAGEKEMKKNIYQKKVKPGIAAL